MRISDEILGKLELPSKKKREEIQKKLREKINQSNRKIVVLDDDPTGVQTVYNISVYTDWKPESMHKAFAEKNKLFYILTNSRSLTGEETIKVHREIMKAVDDAAKACGADYFVISRSDSTLRGHYPLETQILREEYEIRNRCTVDGEILCFFFKEGGRFTIDNVHYVRYGHELISANETEFAKDKTFGYRAYSMPEYIEEKTNGVYQAKDVICISLEDLRTGNVDKICAQLLAVKDFGKVIVNAADYSDLEVFGLALYTAIETGKRFMFRAAAALVKVIGGIPDRALLKREEMMQQDLSNGGLVVVGSHTNKTTVQLEKLRELPGIEFVELDVTNIEEKALEINVKACIAREEQYIREGRTVCCYTTRKEQIVGNGNKDDELRLATRISAAVQELVRDLSVIPSFIVAKGGITSSDIGTKALRVTRADVLGQIQPGIPVWKTDEDSRLPGIPYVIFPGNVGEDDTLQKVVRILVNT